MSGTAEIISYTVETGIDEKALMLSNAEASRKLEVGTSWTKIRIGLLVAFDNSSTLSTSDNRFSFGLINDPSTGIGSATPDHFFGVEFNKLGALNIVYNSGQGGLFYIFSGTGNDINNTVNGSVANSENFNIGSTHGYLISDFATEKKSPFLLDIEKGTPNWKVSVYVVREPTSGMGTAAPWDVTESELDELMILQDPTMLGVPQELVADGGEKTITAPDEATNGNLDHFTVYFQNTTSKFVIPTIKVSRFS